MKNNQKDEFQNLLKNFMYNSAMQLLNRRHYISQSGSLPYSDSSFDSSLHYLKKWLWSMVGLHFQPCIGAMSARPTSAIVLLNCSWRIFFNNFFLLM